MRADCSSTTQLGGRWILRKFRSRFMKILRRLEVISSILYFCFVVADLYFVSIPFAHALAVMRNDPSLEYEWTSLSSVVGLSLYLTVPISAYIHAYKRSYVALLILIGISTLVPLALLLAPFVGSTWPKPPWYILCAGLFGITTIIVALINTVANLQLQQETVNSTKQSL